jgi:putative ABC transport system substrate-binding protein
MWDNTVGSLIALTLSLWMVLCAAYAQTAKTMPRIGMILGGTRSPSTESPQWQPGGVVAGFRDELRALGYSEGQTIAFEYRWGENTPERWPALVAELAALPVDVLVVYSGAAAQAARQVTTTIPIVVAASGSDLVETGLVASMARPGGNVTGLTLMTTAMHQKRLELLKEAVPGLSHVAVLAFPSPSLSRQWAAFETAARGLGLELRLLSVRHPDDLDGALAAAVQAGSQAIITAQQPFARQHRARIAALALQHRVPTMSGEVEFAEAGGLMTYGPNIAESWRRAASYVDKILKGTQPADLPVEQPRRFELVLNLKTAKALGITLPPTLLILADKVLQ